MVINRDLIKEINQLTRSSPFYAKLSQPKYHNLKGYIDQESVTFQLARQLFRYQSYNSLFLVEDFTNKQALIVFENLLSHKFQINDFQILSLNLLHFERVAQLPFQHIEALARFP